MDACRSLPRVPVIIGLPLHIRNIRLIKKNMPGSFTGICGSGVTRKMDAGWTAVFDASVTSTLYNYSSVQVTAGTASDVREWRPTSGTVVGIWKIEPMTDNANIDQNQKPQYTRYYTDGRASRWGVRLPKSGYLGIASPGVSLLDVYTIYIVFTVMRPRTEIPYSSLFRQQQDTDSANTKAFTDLYSDWGGSDSRAFTYRKRNNTTTSNVSPALFSDLNLNVGQTYVIMCKNNSTEMKVYRQNSDGTNNWLVTDTTSLGTGISSKDKCVKYFKRYLVGYAGDPEGEHLVRGLGGCRKFADFRWKHTT